jgi:hypothetical protein
MYLCPKPNSIMTKLLSLIFSLLVFTNCKTSGNNNKTLVGAASNTVPANLRGDFKDDYDITYTINDSVWIQHPGVKYHIIQYDSKEQYFIAKNDNNNPGDPGLYTRIDIMYFSDMDPWIWGFCLTVYNAKTFEEAVSKQNADRDNPKKGCGGYPFSRMKKRN